MGTGFVNFFLLVLFFFPNKHWLQVDRRAMLFFLLIFLVLPVTSSSFKWAKSLSAGHIRNTAEHFLHPSAASTCVSLFFTCQRAYFFFFFYFFFIFSQPSLPRTWIVLPGQKKRCKWFTCSELVAGARHCSQFELRPCCAQTSRPGGCFLTCASAGVDIIDIRIDRSPPLASVIIPVVTYSCTCAWKGLTGSELGLCFTSLELHHPSASCLYFCLKMTAVVLVHCGHCSRRLVCCLAVSSSRRRAQFLTQLVVTASAGLQKKFHYKPTSLFLLAFY